MTSFVYAESSFRKSLGYCLEDKLAPNQDGQKISLYKDRAEILFYNQCFGGKEDLINQFREIALLNQNVLDPAYNIVLSLPEHERFSKSWWVEVSRECAHAMGFEQKQFVAILHKDTANQHVHIVANRVGIDGHLLNDEFSAYRLRDFVREIENKHDLVHTFDTRQRISHQEKIQLRNDRRLDRLKNAIGETLQTVCDFPAFEDVMQKKDIKIYRNEKGIAFLMDQRITYRGSEAGYSWKKIEAALEQNRQQQELKQHLQQSQSSNLQPSPNQEHSVTQEPSPNQDHSVNEDQTQDQRPRHRISHHL